MQFGLKSVHKYLLFWTFDKAGTISSNIIEGQQIYQNNVSVACTRFKKEQTTLRTMYQDFYESQFCRGFQHDFLTSQIVDLLYLFFNFFTYKSNK